MGHVYLSDHIWMQHVVVFLLPHSEETALGLPSRYKAIRKHHVPVGLSLGNKYSNTKLFDGRIIVHWGGGGMMRFPLGCVSFKHTSGSPPERRYTAWERHRPVHKQHRL